MLLRFVDADDEERAANAPALRQQRANMKIRLSQFIMRRQAMLLCTLRVEARNNQRERRREAEGGEGDE